MKKFKLLFLIISLILINGEIILSQENAQCEIIKKYPNGSLLVRTGNKTFLAITGAMEKDMLKMKRDLLDAELQIALKDSLLANFDKTIAWYDETSKNMKQYIVELEAVLRGYKGLFKDYKKLKEDKATLTFQIRAKGPLYDGREKSLTYIRIEISKREKIFHPAIKEEIIPVYRDLPPYLISVMEPSEMMAEKVRAIFTRDKARDVYDLYFLIKRGITTKMDLIKEKLHYYNVRFDIDAFLMSVEKKKKLWFNELNHLISNVPDFNAVKEEIKKWIRNMD